MMSRPDHQPSWHTEHAEPAVHPRGVGDGVACPDPAGPGWQADPAASRSDLRPEVTGRERMAADRAVVDRLREVGFRETSREWRLVAKALLEYGYPVLVAWGLTGELASKVAKQGGASRAKVPTDLRLCEDDARALAAEVLIVSIRKFRTSSLPMWDPDRGASLKTFFIGRCLLEVGDAYKAWHDREHEQAPAATCWTDDGRQCERPDEQAEATVLADQLLRDSPVLREMLQMQVDGYSLSEIATKFATTPASVRTTLHRGRRRHQRRAEEEDR